MDNYELDLRVGDVWFAKVMDEKYGFDYRIMQLGKNTIVLEAIRHSRQAGAANRYELSDINFIEKINERDLLA